MFDEFATAAPVAASPLPVRDATEPHRQRRLTGFARQQLVASRSAASAGAAPAAQHAAQDLVQEIQAIATTVLGSAVAAKASFSDAGLDSLGEGSSSHRQVQGVELHSFRLQRTSSHRQGARSQGWLAVQVLSTCATLSPTSTPWSSRPPSSTTTRRQKPWQRTSRGCCPPVRHLQWASCLRRLGRRTSAWPDACRRLSAP